VDVQTLLQGGNEVCLVHQGVEYHLRVTRQGKLLLTK
jgi:hemin uptake protein HemP